MGTLIGIRWHGADLEAIEAFAKTEKIDRAEAIRRLVRLGLTASTKKKGRT